ncbi:nuclear transport factor 2 family protein [Bosea sp. 2YAB26]|uniref:nuclear transport factor 2 family protein n=1 Tax=unclassified Bosea (in: a-proteobacteria) TaxID=2653178 RepID=UPI003F8F41A2
MSGDKQTIIDLETRFWQSMVDKDAKLAKSMIAEECLITGPMGAMKIDPAKYEAMTEEGRWTLRSFKLSDVDVIMPTDEVAVIAYKVHQKGDMKGKPMDMKCADSTTWVRDGQSWKCALHTETMLENA